MDHMDYSHCVCVNCEHKYIYIYICYYYIYIIIYSLYSYNDIIYNHIQRPYVHMSVCMYIYIYTCDVNV